MTTTQPTISAPRFTDHAMRRLRERWGIVHGSDARAWLREMLGRCEIMRTRLQPYKPLRRYWIVGDTAIVTEDNTVITAYRMTPVQRACLLYDLGATGEDEGEGAA